MKTHINTYYLQALDNYPYNLEETLSALNYALSYDPKDAYSLCLMARVFSEELHNYEVAKYWFEEALNANIENIQTPLYYIDCLLKNEEYDQALTLIEFAKKLKGIDSFSLSIKAAFRWELLAKPKKALQELEQSKTRAIHAEQLDYVASRIEFIEKKFNLKKKKNKEKSKQKKST